jgi:hypothetical protein
MGFFQRITHDFRTGLAKLRYGTVQAAHRALEETELLQVRLEIRKLDGQLDTLYSDIGERALDLHERGEAPDRILRDPDLVRKMEETVALKTERGKLVQEMNDVRGGEQ